MEPLSFSRMEAESEAFDYAAFRTPDIDPFCSSTSWILPCREAWAPGAVPRIFRAGEAFAAFLEYPGGGKGGGRIWTGFDTAWEFACPLVGRAAEPFARACARWPADLLLIPGIRRDSPLFADLVRRLDGRYSLRRGPAVGRRQASLEGGFDAFLARRGPKFRREALRARRRAAEAGVRIEPSGPGSFGRMLDVERRSWKGAEGEGLAIPRMAAFYRALVERLEPRGGIRALFARRDGQDLGYILGGVRDGIYRGFQFSFAEEGRRLGVGNLLQLAQVEMLCAEGVVLYDLGIDLEYKRRWGEILFETVTLAASRRAG